MLGMCAVLHARTEEEIGGDESLIGAVRGNDAAAVEIVARNVET